MGWKREGGREKTIASCFLCVCVGGSGFGVLVLFGGFDQRTGIPLAARNCGWLRTYIKDR